MIIYLWIFMGILSSNMETPANQKRSSKAWTAAQLVHELCLTAFPAFPARDTSECPNHPTLELNLQDVSQPLQITIGGQQCLAIQAVDLHQLDQIRQRPYSPE